VCGLREQPAAAIGADQMGEAQQIGPDPGSRVIAQRSSAGSGRSLSGL
jgi:hypothetical protein